MLVPILLAPIALVIGALRGHGIASGSGAQVADTTPSSGDTFVADGADRTAQAAVERTFDGFGLRGATVAVRSAAAGGHTIRLVTAQYSGLKNETDEDRAHLLGYMEQIADTSFPEDEIFVGLQGRILWGGRSHRKRGEKWSRLVDKSTPSPETDARAALRALELAAPAAPTGDASAAAAHQ